VNRSGIVDELLNKIRGGLYGQALGDAWGMPALFNPADTWEMYGGWITHFMDGPDNHPVHKGFIAGRVTDDTEQAMALAEAIIAQGKVSIESAAKALVAWYDRIGGDDSPYVGPSSRRAIQAIKRGQDLHTTGLWGDTNGAAMRISPVGLIHPGDVEGAVRDAYTVCIPTHNTDVAISGAAAVAGAIAAALQPGSSLDEVIKAGRRAAELGRGFGPHWLGASVSKRIDLAVGIAGLDIPAYDRLMQIYDVVGAGLPIAEAVPAAFGVVALAQGDPQQAAIYAASLSGDADTIGAMACAICGSWAGAEKIGDEIIHTLQTSNPEMDFEKTALGLAKIAKG
jgi:ADP-ribosylglycohydrolase